MNPTGISYVRLTDHAEDRLADVDGVGANLVFGRVRALHGRLYRDDEESKWELYLPDFDVAIKFAIEIESLQKVAVVVTVFDVTDAEARYYGGDRFTRWWVG